MIYAIADNHMNHKNILKYQPNRVFNSIKEHDEFNIKQWNSVITVNDIVIHVGDIGFGTKDKLTELVGRLRGYKILIRGNHDGGIKRMLDIGFDEVYTGHLVFDNFIFIHDINKLQFVPEQTIVCGHRHNLETTVKQSRNYCINYNGLVGIHVGVDAWNFTPVSLDELNRIRVEEKI